MCIYGGAVPKEERKEKGKRKKVIATPPPGQHLNLFSINRFNRRYCLE